MLRWLPGFRRQPKPSFEERFRELVQVHGLEGRTDIRDYFGYGQSFLKLYRIIGEDELDTPLPETFVEATRALIREYWGQREFYISRKGITLRQIRAHQAMFDLDAAVCGD